MGQGQPTTNALDTINRRRMHINHAQQQIHNHQPLGGNAIASQANWLQMGLQDKHNPDGTIQYNALLLIQGYEQTHIRETYATVRKPTTL
jgi:hypothetical protein